MKKILSTILLCVFCTVQSVCAGGVVITDSNEQAKDETEPKNNPYNHTYINNTNDIKIKMEKYIKNAPQTIENYPKILKQCNYHIFDRSSKSNKEFIEIELQDGDYVIWFKGSPYIAEYHKNEALMGLIKVEIVDKSDDGFTQVFYEYRIPQINNYSNKGNVVAYSFDTKMDLKHILIVHFNANSKQSSQYIYSAQGELLCSQEGNNIYVSENARNMFPNWSKKRKYSRDSVIISYSPTPGIPVIKKKRNTIARRVIKASMFPFAFTGAIATLAFFPIIMTNLNSPIVNSLEDAYSFYENFTNDEEY